uniref:Acyl-coenzyme A thioesterase 4-like n=1 Tax=Labrus bergylta TaxID=56723 RepID=A0A3Q3EIX4_9LABR|nr:acyl-coenzyme A thioesterase 4-like [Labrus bergylta]XP_020512028.1 acyl-coenzyme A thioesterase 4-like [Labrus bergylta]XP_029137583.1 acyl-coenzyme A thioesterase 4-like [Labrus bergylta]XP_029137584.1 acyl-coenzyme A thioesterase 4-like [Labrus bergylta]
MSQTIPPVLSVVPTRALVDETFKVVVENLPPASPVTLHALLYSEDKDYWEAYGHYVSDHRGTVSVAEDMSLGGTYTGKEAMGLLWSMRPEPGSRTGLRLRKREVTSPMLVHISVYSGHITEGFRKQSPLASVPTERWYMAPGVQRIEIKEKGVRGTFFIPPGPGPFPGLLDMWGGRGGLLEYRSALLASHGYASLALEYFSPSELQSADLQIQYFETAFNIIKDHPQVIPDKVGILGLSLGTMLAFNLVAESTKIKPRCCVCISGHHLVSNRLMIDGSLPNDPKKLRFDENNYLIRRDVVLPVPSDPSQKIDVRNIKCPMLLVNGDDDQNSPTVEAAEDIGNMMRSGGNLHLLSTLTYPDTGHLIEPPYSPHFRATTVRAPRTKEKVMILWGGQTKPHSDAQEDSWRKILAYLHHHLYSSTTPKAKM